VSVPAFIGDEITATAWRLLGVRATAVDAGNAAQAFEAALGDTGLLLITAACAAEIDRERLDEATRRADPLILVVPDAANRLAPPDLDREVDRVLGIEQ
jgi:vacuolar-type H+-ATPase subunit F/Vma7